MEEKEKEIKTTHRNGIVFSYKNREEFESVYEEIFIKKTWDFKSNNLTPKILDVGSHIGVSILYFKKFYPHAKIWGFEPNPDTFKLLQKNIRQNELKNVSIENVAISDKEGEIEFYIGKNSNDQNWSWGDAAVKNKWYSPDHSKTIKVKSVRLSQVINSKIDLLKLDVEGMEERILKESKQKLNDIKEIMLEFHGSSTNSNNDINNILDILKANEYSVKINQDWKWIDKKDLKKTDPYWASVYASR